MGASVDPTTLLNTAQMADFVADGFLAFESVVPNHINQAMLDELPDLLVEKMAVLSGGVEPDGGWPLGPPPTTGTPVDQLRTGTAVAAMLALPRVRGLIRSLVGPRAIYDHDFVHHLPAGHRTAQHLHADAIVDTPDPAFDIQLFWFPHDVSSNAGGTRYVPGTHLRRLPSGSTARYQHVVGERFAAVPAGTVLVFHHGLWHAGSANPGAQDRWMYKLRLNPAVPQVRLWATSDLDRLHNDPTDHIFASARPGTVAEALRRRHPWQGTDAHRYDQVRRVELWRYLTGDPRYDVDHYLTRLDRPLVSTPANDG